MDCMHPDCCFETVAGDEVYGTRIQGHEAVRQAFENTFKSFPDAQWLNGKHWLSKMRYTEFLKQHLQHQPLKVERLKPTWLMFSPLKMEKF